MKIVNSKTSMQHQQTVRILELLGVSVSKSQRNHSHGKKKKIDFTYTLSVCRARWETERYGVSFLKYSIKDRNP